MQVLTLLYAACGILLSLPIKTHAVKLDMPPSAIGSALDEWGPFLLPIGGTLLLVVIPLIITRVLAAILARWVKT